MASSSDGDRPWQSYHTVYTNAKAGMDGVDKEKVQRIIYEMSKGSKYFENEKRKEAFINQKIEKLRAQCEKLTSKDIAHFQMVADRRILHLEVSRDLSKLWLHTDMDAFYASVETLQNPSLKEKPVAVGNLSMICTANYEARKFGVRAAMPGFIACKLCPDLIFVPTNFEKYTYYSELTRKVFRKYDPNFIATSLDEAYLNITDVCTERGISSEEVASELRNSIYEETGLTCSVGVAPNRMLAKVCSDINKPNGQFILPSDRKAVMTFVSSLPIRKSGIRALTNLVVLQLGEILLERKTYHRLVGGIGKVTEHILKDVLGIRTCEEMLQKGAFLYALFSHCSSDFFISIGLGLGGTDTPQQRLRKSISSERTFSATSDESLLFWKLADIAETLSNDMQKESLVGRTLTLKLKTASFEVRTRAVSMHKYIQSKEDILSYASKLLKAELPLSLRLMGLRMSQFCDDKPGLLRLQKTLTSFFAKDGITSSEKFTGSDMCDRQLILCEEIDISVTGTSGFPEDENELAFGPDKLCESEQLVNSEKFFTDMHVDKRESMKEEVLDKFIQSNCSEEINDIGKSLDCKKVVPSRVPSSQDVEPFWRNDYICSVCGVELPTSFVKERQEHSDYHVAEMLQKEESVPIIRNSTRERSVQWSLQPKDPARKKQKSSRKEGKHIPIDTFFIKGKKNL